MAVTTTTTTTTIFYFWSWLCLGHVPHQSGVKSWLPGNCLRLQWPAFSPKVSAENSSKGTVAYLRVWKSTWIYYFSWLGTSGGWDRKIWMIDDTKGGYQIIRGDRRQMIGNSIPFRHEWPGKIWHRMCSRHLLLPQLLDLDLLIHLQTNTSHHGFSSCIWKDEPEYLML